MVVRVTFLGTGTSTGVPVIGCTCPTCRSDDPRDRRWRPCILIQLADGIHVLVDTPPDLRSQALAFGVARVDAILFTHAHADHVLGLDDVRPFNFRQRAPIPCYGDAPTITAVRRMFAYVFDKGTPAGGGLPELALFTLNGPVVIGRTTFLPVPVWHGDQLILGYRVGRFAYLTDCSGIPDGSWPLLEGVATLVIDALRDRPHPTHFSVAQAIEAVGRISPMRTYLTHMGHDLPHAATCARLPAGMELAYDGLVLEIED